MKSVMTNQKQVKVLGAVERKTGARNKGKQAFCISKTAGVCSRSKGREGFCWARVQG